MGILGVWERRVLDFERDFDLRRFLWDFLGFRGFLVVVG